MSLSPIYLVEVDYQNLGREFVSNREHTRRDVIANIASGEWEHVCKVLEINEDERSCINVTEDVAREVADLFYASRDPVSWGMANWLHEHLGVTATHSLNFHLAAE